MQTDLFQLMKEKNIQTSRNNFTHTSVELDSICKSDLVHDFQHCFAMNLQDNCRYFFCFALAKCLVLLWIMSFLKGLLNCFLS